jgi:hypothetical protein
VPGQTIQTICSGAAANRRNRLSWHPFFQPSAAALGAATAQQILDELRKQLEGVDLKNDAPKKRARKKS